YKRAASTARGGKRRSGKQVRDYAQYPTRPAKGKEQRDGQVASGCTRSAAKRARSADCTGISAGPGPCAANRPPAGWKLEQSQGMETKRAGAQGKPRRHARSFRSGARFIRHAADEDPSGDAPERVEVDSNYVSDRGLRQIHGQCESGIF